MTIRKAMLAGSWYPGDADGCRDQIDDFTRGLEPAAGGTAQKTGGIVPHAGWFFSGAIACRVFHQLSAAPAPDVVVIFGMHMRPGASPCIMTRGRWETPLGMVDIHEDLATELSGRVPFSTDQLNDYARDNTIELQMPFVRHFFPDTLFVPVGVPPNDVAGAIGRAVADIAAANEWNVLVIGSTDLTHYGPNYGFMPEGSGTGALAWVKDENDRRVIDAMLDLDAGRVISEALRCQNACCAGAAAAAIAAGKAMGATTPDLMAYATSYDKSPGSSFVGYAGIIF